MNYDEAASYLNGLIRLGIKLGNDRFEALLSLLGDPHADLKAIHIAGTKGKGSTALFAASVLRAAGYRVGVYLSPYVYDLRERVQVDGEMISRDDFARIATIVRAASERLQVEQPELGPTTEFEFKTAIGFTYLAEQSVDYGVIEVGLGGRLDATNVLRKPLVSVITNIGYDHTQLLGDTLTLIAGEKAGIVRPGGVCVTGATAPEALERIELRCEEQRARLFRISRGDGWQFDDSAPGGSGLSVHTAKRRIDGLELGVRGDFQHANAALAVHALDTTIEPIAIGDDAVRRGLAAARIPGRVEIVRALDPLIVVDAAHNEMAAEALSISLTSEFQWDRRPAVLVVGMSKGHEPAEFLEGLLHGARIDNLHVIATQPEFRPRDAGEIADAARALGVSRVDMEKSVPAAAARAVDRARELGKDAMIVVTGSFFTLGELPTGRWQEIFELRGLNERIPADIMKAGEKITR